jgi:hypothetical protein
MIEEEGTERVFHLFSLARAACRVVIEPA